MTGPTRPSRAGGRTLGLDVGDRRIGVAISDPDGRLAVPVRTIERDRRGGEMEANERLAREEEVVLVVVGLPLSLSGERGQQAERTAEVGRDLERRLGLPVVFWDERLSTAEAERWAPEIARSERRARAKPSRVGTDAMAATVILQGYLDRQRLHDELGS